MMSVIKGADLVAYRLFRIFQLILCFFIPLELNSLVTVEVFFRVSLALRLS